MRSNEDRKLKTQAEQPQAVQGAHAAKKSMLECPYIVMAYIVMAYIVMSYMDMANIVNVRMRMRTK